MALLLVIVVLVILTVFPLLYVLLCTPVVDKLLLHLRLGSRTKHLQATAKAVETKTEEHAAELAEQRADIDATLKTIKPRRPRKKPENTCP